MDEEYDDIREAPQTLVGILGDAVVDTIAWIFFVATVIAVIFGIVSWCALNKFRTFRNYVLLSAIIADMLLMLVLQLSDRFISQEAVENNEAVRVLPLALFVFFQSLYQYWLLVLCYVFSVDFVQVFHYDMRKKYLWSNLFAWGVPFATVLLYVVVGSILISMPDDESKDIFDGPTVMGLVLIPVVLSLITYIAVVCRLFCGSSSNNLCRGFFIATLIFVFSNVILFTVVPSMLEKNVLAVDIIGEVSEYVLTIALIVFVVVLKSNWKLWRDYFNKRSAPESGVMLGDQRI